MAKKNRPNPFLLTLLLGLLSISGLYAELTDYRTWSDQSGRQIEAKLISYDEAQQKGSFRRSDDYVVEIPFSLLASQDQSLITELLKVDNAEDSDETPPTESQSEDYVISGLSKGRTDGFIKTKEGWEHEIQALCTKVRYRGDASKGKQYLKAYFYDRDQRLIQSYESPPRIQTDEGKYTNPPETYERNENEEVYFPFSNYLEERDWQRCIVVFGDQNEATARIYPSGDLEEYAFAERKLIFGENLKKKSSNQDATTTEFQINSARKKRFKATAWVDGRWIDGAQGILVEVEVSGSLPSGSYFLRVHFYNRDNERIFTVNDPAQIESDDAANTYTSLPKFANTDEEMIAFFPFENKIESSEWRKAVIVFGNMNSVDVAIIGGDSSDLQQLKYPEKAQFNPAQ